MPSPVSQLPPKQRKELAITVLARTEPVTGLAQNIAQDLSNVRIGIHDELFQGAKPVLAGTDHDSGYCSLLSAENHRDADTWGIHVLDLRDQGLNPAYTIADQAKGLDRNSPCRGSRVMEIVFISSTTWNGLSAFWCVVPMDAPPLASSLSEK